MQGSHYRLDLDTTDGRQSFVFATKDAAMAAFEKHARLRDVLSAELTARKRGGEFAHIEAVCVGAEQKRDR